MADAPVAEQTVLIQNELGPGRARGDQARCSSRRSLPCDITVAKEDPRGQRQEHPELCSRWSRARARKVTVKAKGERGASGVAAIVQLINDKFGEGK